MSKETQKLAKTLNEKEAKQKDRVEKAKVELIETQGELAKLRAKLDNAENRDEFTAIYAEVQKLEAVEKFCQSRLNDTGREPIVTDQEAKDMRKTVRELYDKVLSDQRPVIMSKIDDLMKTIQTATDDITELNNILQELARLRRENFSPLNIHVLGNNADPFDKYGQFITAYFKVKENELRLARMAGKK